MKAKRSNDAVVDFVRMSLSVKMVNAGLANVLKRRKIRG